MRFKKLGVIHPPSMRVKNLDSWKHSHAYMPTPVAKDNGEIRLFVTHKDNAGIWRVGYLDLNQQNPLEVIEESKEPVLDVGAPGTFDEHGVVASSIVNGGDGNWYLYYFGWQNIHGKLPRYLFTGIGTSTHLGKFKRQSEVPILDRWNKERFLRSAPFTRMEDKNFACYYAASNRLDDIDGNTVPHYHIVRADSACGWKFDNDSTHTLLRPKGGEQGLTRPWIVQGPDDKKEYMFYSIRNRETGDYSIGYAVNQMGAGWKRKDKIAGLTPSGELRDYDYRSISYATVIRTDESVYMFYNGYNYGGRGVAVAELTEW